MGAFRSLQMFSNHLIPKICYPIFLVCVAVWISIPVGWSKEIGIEDECYTAPIRQTNSSDHKLVVLLLDGFDYYERDKQNLPGITKVIEEGIQAKWVEPVFPSISYPNWMTLSTGLYTESHGIIGNYMYDMREDKYFSLSEDETTNSLHWWENMEPIWTTATRYNRKTYLRNWARCDIPIKDIKPSDCSPYREDIGNKTRDLRKGFRDTLKLFIRSDFSLSMLYSGYIDDIGHIYGPDSNQTVQAVRDIDSAILKFLGDLERKELSEKVNFMIVSDHGMKDTGPNAEINYVYLEELVNEDDILKSVDQGALSMIFPYAKRIDLVYEDLKRSEHLDVYLRHEIPDEFRFKWGRLSPPVLAVAKPNAVIMGLRKNNTQIPTLSDPYKKWPGLHGYYNTSDMRTIFYAKGPDFKEKIKIGPLTTVDIYQIYPFVLGFPPQCNNGTWKKVSKILVNNGSLIFSHFSTIGLLSFLLLLYY